MTAELDAATLARIDEIARKECADFETYRSSDPITRDEQIENMLVFALTRFVKEERARHAAEVERLRGEKVGRFVCSECGPDMKGDEDGCCVACGRDCAIEELKWMRTYEPPDFGMDDAALREGGDG